MGTTRLRAEADAVGADVSQDEDEHTEVTAEPPRRARKPAQRAGRSARPPRRSVVFAGDLQSLGLASLLTLLEMERKTGVLDVRGDLRMRLHLRDGRVVRAGVRGIGVQRRGREALFAALAVGRGAFEFRAVAVHGFDEIRGTVAHLLLEAAQRADEVAA